MPAVQFLHKLKIIVLSDVANIVMVSCKDENILKSSGVFLFGTINTSLSSSYKSAFGPIDTGIAFISDRKHRNSPITVIRINEMTFVTHQ